MGELVIRNGLKIVATLASGTGDEILTRDATTNALGSISAIDTTVFVSKTLPSANIYVGNGSNVATAVAMSGDIAVDNAGVTSIASGVIVNADVNASAAIALSKLAATTTSRALASDGSGVITPSATTSTELGYVSGVTSGIQGQLNAKQATITGGASTITTADLTLNRALIANGSGKVAVSAVTDTELGYMSGVTSAVQTQMDTKQPDIQFKDEGVNQGTSGGVSTVDFTGAGVTATEAAGVLTVNIAGVANGLPTGGTAGQYLRKASGTDYDSAWDTPTVSDITDLTASAAELNIMDGVTASTAEINYIDGVVGPIQAQLDTKLSTALTQNYILVGNASNQAAQVANGSAGQVLTIVGGVPTWTTPGAGGGTVTSVAVSGGSTGLSVTGSPITTSGTITLTGTLIAANGGTGFASYAVGDILQADTTTTLAKLAAVATGNVLLSGGVSTISSWGKVTSAHVDSSVATSTTAWMVASGGTLTAANTIAMAGFDVNFLNGNTLFGPTGATITASTRMDIRGTGTTTNNLFRLADSSNNAKMTVLDQGSIIWNSTGGSPRYSFQTSGTTALSVESDGAIGIGASADLKIGRASDALAYGNASTNEVFYFTLNEDINQYGYYFRILAAQTITGGSNREYFVMDGGAISGADSGAGTPTLKHLVLKTTYNTTADGQLTYVSAEPTFTDYDGPVTGFDWNPTTPANIAGTHIAYRSTSGSILFANSSGDTATANTRLDVRGISGGNAQVWKNNSGTQIGKFQNDGKLYIDDYLYLGSESASGDKYIYADSTGSNAGLYIWNKGSGQITIFTDTAGNGNVSVAGNNTAIGGVTYSGAIGDTDIVGNSSSTSGTTGGSVYIRSGEGLVGNANSGNIYIYLGDKAGSGVKGNIGIFSANADFDGGQDVIRIASRAAAPSGAILADNAYLYVEDIAAGNAALHTMTEAGDILKLYAVGGWGTPTNTLTRTTFDTSTVTLPQLAERVGALISDLKTLHGLLKA